MTALKLVMTSAGLFRFAAAQADDDIDLTIATIGLSAAAFVAAPTLTALPGEFRRIAMVSGEVAGDGIVHLVVQDDSPLTYQIRGFGLFLADGTLFAAYSQPTPIAEKATGSLLGLALDIAFPVAGIDQITFGSTNFVNPPATTSRKGVVRLATAAEVAAGTAQDLAITPADLRHALPIGAITLWHGLAETVPPGWAICDGREVDRSDGAGKVTTPDLRDRVAVGAGGFQEPMARFGATEKTVSSTSNATDVGLAFTFKTETAGGGTDKTVKTATIVDPGHKHGVTVDVTQPSLALLYIMKV